MEQHAANEEIWKATLNDLELQIGNVVFNRWLANAQLIASSQGLFTIAVQSAQAVDWLQQKLQRTICAAVCHIAKREIEINFVVGDSAETSTENTYTFQGFFYAPNMQWIQVPPYLLDNIPHHVRSVSFQLIMTVWRQTWGVIDARGAHTKEWLTHVKSIAILTGLSINSVKAGISEARQKGLVIQRCANNAEERARYEIAHGVRLHSNAKLIALRPRWEDEPADVE